MKSAAYACWSGVAWMLAIVVMGCGAAIAICLPAWGAAAWIQWLVLGVALLLAGGIAAYSIRRRRDDAARRTSRLETQQRELLGILQGMSIAVVAVDRSTSVLSMNPAACELLGLGDREPRGSTLRALALDGDLCTFVDSAIAGGGRRSGDLHIGSDPVRDIVLRSEPVHDGSGDLHGIVLVLDDVTRLRRLEAMRSDFAANVSHELRTPITAIQGYAELLADAPGDSAAGYADIIQRNSCRLSNIIEDLLALARLEDSDHAASLDEEQVELHELLDAVARACSAEAEAAHVTVAVCCDGHLVVNGSRPLLEQAVGNLLTNAIHYGVGDSTVRLEAEAMDSSEANGAEVCISIIDRGPGIPPEHHGRVFERFYRVDRGRSRQVGGTGLGLAIVKHIAQVHGGSVNLAATTGGGCTFTLRLPLVGE